MAATEVSNLRPEDHSIPEGEAGAKRASISLACIVPLALTHTLLNAHCMSLADAYTLLSERTAA